MQFLSMYLSMASNIVLLLLVNVLMSNLVRKLFLIVY